MGSVKKQGEGVPNVSRLALGRLQSYDTLTFHGDYVFFLSLVIPASVYNVSCEVPRTAPIIVRIASKCRVSSPSARLVVQLSHTRSA